MHPAIRMKYKRYEATIKRLKAVIGKRNQLFTRLRYHYEDPHTALLMMLRLLELKYKWAEQGLELMDYIILEAVMNKNLFHFEDVENIVLSHPEFYQHTAHGAVRCTNRLLKLGYIRVYTKRKEDNYFITMDGRLFIEAAGREVFKMIRGTIK